MSSFCFAGASGNLLLVLAGLGVRLDDWYHHLHPYAAPYMNGQETLWVKA